VAALREAARQLVDETLSAGAAASPEEGVRRGLETYLGFVERRGRAYVALMRGGIGSDPEVAAVIEEVRATILARIFAELPAGVRRGPLARAALRGWIGFVEAASLDWVARRAVSKRQLVGLATAVLLEAVRAAGQGRGH
jgi:hypothetical protein